MKGRRLSSVLGVDGQSQGMRIVISRGYDGWRRKRRRRKKGEELTKTVI
jgi:hypothetical protein